MTTIPKPADPTQSFTATYDAWNRLVRIEEGANKVAEYEYDGAKRRTVKKTYVSGQLDETRHFFYTDPAAGKSSKSASAARTNADRQFVWGLRYVDDLILRDRDTNADGTLDERLYGMQDANWNVTSIASSTQHRAGTVRLPSVRNSHRLDRRVRPARLVELRLGDDVCWISTGCRVTLLPRPA